MKGFLRRRQDGTTLIEVIVAVVLLSLLGLGVARAFMASSRSLVAGQNLKRATTLADMVYEQYTAYSLQNFAQLYSHNVTTAAPQAFFGTADNLGFNQMRITTLTEYSTDRSSASVAVTVSWREGQQEKKIEFKKQITERNVRTSGGSIEVWVKASADPAAPGLPGFIVSAPPELDGDPDVTAITNPNGVALLEGVKIGNGIMITAISKMSACDTPHDSLSFKQGYYIYDNVTHTYRASATKPVTVYQTIASSVTFTSFLPARRLAGSLTNASPDLLDGEGAPVSGMMVKLQNFIGPAGEGASNYVNQTECTVTTNNAGEYSFSNIIPGTPKVWAFGTPGSALQTPRTSANFNWGYVGTQPPVNWPVTPWVNGPVKFDGPPLQVQRMGWLRIDTIDNGGNPLTNARVSLSLPGNQFYPFSRDYSQDDSISADPTNPGSVYLYNVFAECDVSIDYEAWRDPQGGDTGWASAGYRPVIYPPPAATACMETETVNTVTMSPGGVYTGMAYDVNGNPYAGLGLEIMTTGERGLHVVTESAGGTPGRFTFQPFFRLHYGNNGEQMQFDMGIPGGATWNSAIDGTIWDGETDEIQPHFHVTAGNNYIPDGNAQPISEANGHFHLSGQFSSGEVIGYGIVTCDTPPYPTPPTCSGDVQQQNEIEVWFMPVGPYWDESIDGSAMISSGNTSGGVILNTRLLFHRIYGTVTDSGGQPLSGIVIMDTTSSATATTLANGTYTLLGTVVGRDSGTGGRVNLSIDPVSMDGTTFEGWAQSVALPTQTDPAAGKQLNITLNGTSGGGGSM